MIDEAIAKVNQRLKAAASRGVIDRRGDYLAIRATLPPKPNTNKQQPFQQRISLGIKATTAGLQHVEQKAKLLSAHLGVSLVILSANAVAEIAIANIRICQNSEYLP
jgi:hypothetical protein